MWWGRQPHLARAHREDQATDPAGPYPAGGWGDQQTAVRQGAYTAPVAWLAVIENPHPGRAIRALGVRGGTSAFALVGVTTWDRPEAPLAPRREMHLAIDGPVDASQVTVIDGTLIRRFAVDPPDRAGWLGESGLLGLGNDVRPAARLIVELAGTPNTGLRIGGRTVSLAALEAGFSRTTGEHVVTRLPLPSVPVRIRLVEDGKLVSGRVHVRAADGRELAPDGRGRTVSDRFLEDRGTDALVGGWRYSYVEGSFDLPAPPGDLFIEVARGPEFETLRSVRAAIGGAPIELEPRRIANLRAEGWLASDTHVHFVSPRALHRQAVAEGLQLVHLMSAQWGELFTSTEDLMQGPAAASADAIVWTGTENRHHALGHLLAVGTPSVRPLSSGGPEESGIGDATRVTIADWAGQARASGGLAILAHFPDPYLEAVADLLLGRVDAIELWFWPKVDGHRTREWYRSLNLGLRIPLVSGTDKMYASTVLGSVRTYAFTGSPDIDFEAWAGTVRAGRTVVTTGPLLEFTVDDRLPGATLDDRESHLCSWRIRSAVPVETFEIVMNGAVVHRESLQGAGPWAGRVELPPADRGWIAARCHGPDVLTESWTPLPFQVGAHTSPIYLARPAIPDAALIRRFRTLLEGAEVWARNAAWDGKDARARFEALIVDSGAVLP